MIDPRTEGARGNVIVVAPAEMQQVGALAALMDELNRYYGTTEFESIEQQVEQIRDALFGPTPAGAALLAWDGDQLVGLASYSFLWPAAGVTRSMFVKELYVAQGRRRQGIGRLLMEKLFAVAAKHGCSRVEWTADEESKGAQRFYTELGVPIQIDKLFYRHEVRGG
jgi:GNAT superfamily N-acetyltransferase